VFIEQLLLIITTPLYLLLIGIEAFVSNYQHKAYYNWKDTCTNMAFMLLNGSLDLLVRGAYLWVLAAVYQYHCIDITNVYWYWFALFVAEDFAFYMLHLGDHYCRLFWAVHLTHHSSEHFNLTTGFRSSVLQPLYRFLYFIPLVLLGFKPVDIVLMYSITQTYGILVHTNYLDSIPILEYILVMPSHHRVHHASNIEYLDKNMGMCLIIWDRIFGTFQDELPDVPPHFGLMTPTKNPNLVHDIFQEWKSIWQDFHKNVHLTIKIRYLLMPPGWSHDGTRQTSAELRRTLLPKQKNQIK
jgi:sterol desaturase/sphingolipid hydroxylase (fatty acid hydroxylase superfamily)